MEKKELNRLINLEHAVGARSTIRDAENRIKELMTEVAEEQRRIAKAREKLFEANAYLQSIGEEVYWE